MKEMFKNFEDMMCGSLGLKKPWYICGTEFDTEKKELHIYVKVHDDAVFSCPKCGKEAMRYGYEKNERIWRHGDCLFFPTFVHCQRPKVKCPDCGVIQIEAPFARKNSSLTLLFEGYVMILLDDMPICKVAELSRINEKTVNNVLAHYVGLAIKNTDLSDVKAISADETSFKKGHDYVTLVIDSDKRRVIDVEPGRDGGTLDKFAEKLEKKGGSKAKIESFASDMSKAFLSAAERNFPNETRTVDKFHVKKKIIEGMENVRKTEQKSTNEKQKLFRGRRLFMIPESRQTPIQSEKIAELSKLYPKTGRAYRMVNALDYFYKSDSFEEAENRFEKLISWLKRSRLQPMKDVAKSFCERKNLIMNYFKNPVTSAICEGINSIVQVAKRKARGYQTFGTFANVIYLICGKLHLACPNPFQV